MRIKYIIIAFVTLLSGVMTSCDDFLAEDAKGSLTPDNFFQNEDEANLALNGLQRSMPASAGGMATLLGTDQGVCGRFVIANGWKVFVFDYETDNNVVAKIWSDQYSGIRDANLLIARIDESPLSDAVKAQTKAQALFYRAMFYFELTTQYGDVPYWRDEVVMEDVSLLGVTSASEIQEDMIEDLEWAITSGGLSAKRWNQNNGRPTVWSVRMLKAYYHIWMNQWDEAQTELAEVTANSPHALSDNYADMYREGNELHGELIFGKEYLSGVLNNRTFEQAHYNAKAENANANKSMVEVGVFARSASLTLRKSFTDTYDANDARKPYNVFDTHTLANGTVATFNFIYMPKLMRAALPLSDPLMQTPDPGFLSSEPARLFNLADAYLLLAEAEFMANGSTTAALEAINKVRTRANLPDLTDLTIEDIRKERAWELAGEGFFGRKKDLIRWGILESTVLATPAAERAAGAYFLATDRAMEDSAQIAGAPMGRYRVYPIPVEEILKSQDLGGALVQNPIWVD